MTEFLSCRPNLEVDDLACATAFLREVLGFEVEVDEPEMGLVLLRRDAVGLALVQSATPGVNTATAAYIGVTGVDDLHEQCAAHGARIVTGIADHPWGLRDFVVEMPGGHRLALGERIAQPRLSRQEPGADHPAEPDCRRPRGHPARQHGQDGDRTNPYDRLARLDTERQQVQDAARTRIADLEQQNAALGERVRALTALVVEMSLEADGKANVIPLKR